MSILEQPLGTSEKFAAIWQENATGFGHPAEVTGLARLRDQQQYPDEVSSTVYITDVTLRDGQQQRTNEVSAAERVAVFDSIVETGVDRVEIGHLGNKRADQELAREIVYRVAQREAEDERYGRVKLQVLFGSQEELIKDGIGVLQEAFQTQYGDDWRKVMSDKVIVHVYDRIDEQLTNTSSNPYTQAQSAERISKAAEYALAAGFKHFSVSAEAATAVTPEEAIQFYRSINTYLVEQGAETVNDNLANTYGFSSNVWWNAQTLAIFNGAVKYGTRRGVTTSIHAHNDVDNAVDFAISAMVGGFDRVEGTINGMGERQGNVANIDVVARLAEAGRQMHEQQLTGRRSELAQAVGLSGLRRTVQLEAGIMQNLGNWYAAAERASAIFGPHAEYRFRRTAVGNPYAFDNGSGPHDQAMKAAIMDPVAHPPYRNYEWSLVPNAILGRELADRLAIGDPDAVRQVTVGNHAGGGSTDRILAGTIDVERAAPELVAEAERNLYTYKAAVLGNMATGVPLVAA